MKEFNTPELIFIVRLRETFSNQFGEDFSNNKLSEFFGSRSLINETLRKKRIFSERILYRIKKSIEENLTLENREIALNALLEYIGKEKKKQTNQPEIDLIDSLRDIISAHQGIPMDYTNLGRFFDNQTLFSKALKEKTSFKEYIIDKIEWIINQNLHGELIIQALNILKKYRLAKKYKIEPSNPVEELISNLQECFSNQNNKFFARSEVSNLIGGKSLLSFSARNNSNLNQLTLIILEQIIEENLTAINKKKALIALQSYKSKIGYSVESTELDFIKDLLKAFSKDLQRDLNLTELSEYFASKSILNESLRKKTKFTKLTLDKIEKSMEENLKGENLKRASKALQKYRLEQGYVDEREVRKTTETKLAENIRRIFISNYNEILSYNKIGELLGDRQLFSRIFYEEKVLKKETIMGIIENAKNVLDGEYLSEIIDLLNKYSKLKRYEKKVEIFNANAKLNEEICRCIFQELFYPHKFPTVSIFTFDWLIGPNGGAMHIDGYNVDLNLGFEFNGIQHYIIDGFLNKTEDNLKRRQKSDSHKENLINEHGKKVIEIPYTVKKKDRINFIIDRCRKLGFEVSEKHINIDLKQIEKKARDKIIKRNQENKKTNKSISSDSILLASNLPNPYKKIKLSQVEIEEDFSDPYLWISPQVREIIQSKAESLIDEVHKDVSVHENFSDPWEEVSKYDNSDLESKITKEIVDYPDVDIIPDQDLEPDPEVSEIQEEGETDDIDINNPNEEIEDVIHEQQELTEDQTNDLEQIYDLETQESPQSQREQEEDSQIPEKSQDQEGTEQTSEQNQIPELSESEPENLSEKTDVDQADSGITNQDEGKDSHNLDEKDENSEEINEEKEDIGDKEEEAKDENKEKDDKDESGNITDEKKDDKDNEQPKEDEEDSKEGEEESNNDDMDDIDKESENGFNPEDIYDPINVIDYSGIYPQIASFQSSNLGSDRINEIDFTDNFGERDNLPGINDCIDNFSQDRDEKIPIDGFDELSEKDGEEDKFDHFT